MTTESVHEVPHYIGVSLSGIQGDSKRACWVNESIA